MLKILFLIHDTSQYAARIHHHWLEEEMAKIADCKFAGLGKPDYRREKVQTTINRLYNGDSPDWVLITAHREDGFWSHYKPPERRDWKIACHIQDMHIPNFIRDKNKKGFDALLMKCMRIKGKGDPDFIIKNLKPKLFHFPFHCNPEIIKPAEGPKIWDITNLGAVSPGPYPLRGIMHRHLPSMAHKYNFKFLTTSWPPGPKGLFIPQLRKDPNCKFYLGKEYYDAIARSKIMVFDSSIYGYAVQKYVECGFLKTLMLTDTPMDAKALHFKPGWNFVEINKNNWAQKLLYYLKHENERLEIVENAYETMMKYHTSGIRARELLAFFEANR